MSRTANASALSFDDHVAEVLALVAEQRPPHTANSSQRTGDRGLARVIPLQARRAADSETHR